MTTPEQWLQEKVGNIAIKLVHPNENFFTLNEFEKDICSQIIALVRECDAQPTLDYKRNLELLIPQAQAESRADCARQLREKHFFGWVFSGSYDIDGNEMYQEGCEDCQVIGKCESLKLANSWDVK